MEFGKQLKECRLKYAKVGLSIFARQIGMLPTDYYDIENGKKFPTSEEWVNSVIYKIFGYDNLEQRTKLLCSWMRERDNEKET